MGYVCDAEPLKVAIIDCSPRDQEMMSYGGAKWTISELVSRRVQAFAHWRNVTIKPRLYWPAGRKHDYPDIEKYDTIIIPGSKLHIDVGGIQKHPWMENLLEFIRDVPSSTSMLGICFGHQAIAAAHGAFVRKIPKPHNAEIGFAPVYKTEYGKYDVLFKDLPNDFEGLFSHFCYLPHPPRGTRVLAYGDIPGMVQAYRIGESTWGVQFHPDYLPHNISELVNERKRWLSKMMDISRIKIKAQQRHDEKVLINFIDHAASV
ncbi:type 1 glutamine amidotransferase [Candidatus Micrarchaeota archaeon]|nr:type 1 glutamine amidotransferase [Candidatus Micrarchaeota archaeon]